jgi:hypothetical protein
MSLIVHRFEVPVDNQWHQHWLNGSLLHVAARRPSVVEFWAQYNTEADLFSREYIVVPTGAELPDVAGWLHAGTCISGAHVYHLVTRKPQGSVPYLRQGKQVEVLKQVEITDPSKGVPHDGYG